MVNSTYIKPRESGTQYNEEDIVSPFDHNNNIEKYITLFSFSQGMLLSLQCTLECVLKCAYVCYRGGVKNQRHVSYNAF